MSEADLGEVLFEFRRVGASVKVSAIHVASGTEVVMVGAASAGEYALKMAALRKLAYVLRGGPAPTNL
jgi:hypothetical protein